MNVVCIVADQHNAEFTGCYGGRTRTPNIDSLASRGVRFDAAYCNYPICAPSRASWFTGRYAHEIGHWDNATPYNGGRSDWGSHLRDAGVLLAVTGKLDFTEAGAASVEQLLTVKIRHNWDVTGLFRDGPPVVRPGSAEQFWGSAAAARRGERPPTGVDAQEEAITAEAIQFLQGRRPSDRPWVLAIHYYKPHPPWLPDPDLFHYYAAQNAPLAAKYVQPFGALNPAEQARSVWMAGYAGDEQGILDAHCAYHAVIERVDRHVGQIVAAINASGLADDTLIIYTADHGEQARAHGAWGKISLYEDSLRVPMVISGPQMQPSVATAPVSLLDLFPTIAEAVGVAPLPFARGRSLLEVADRTAPAPDRPDYAFAECHLFPRPASFAVRRGDWKLIDYVGLEPLLFNLADDPDEMHDLAGDGGAAAAALGELRHILTRTCDPRAVDQRARRDQRARIAQLAATGRLDNELVNRGFRPSTTELTPVKEELTLKYRSAPDTGGAEDRAAGW